MATLKQIDANRRNAQFSTGPTTPEGKRASSINALKSGIYAESETIPTENSDRLEALKSEYYARFQPQTPEARDLVDSLIRNAWLLRRLAAAEASIFNCTCEGCTHKFEGISPSDSVAVRLRLTNDGRKLDLLQRRINATERNYHRSLKALQALQPPSEPAQPEEPKPTSGKLASFPERVPESQEPAPGAAPSDSCLLTSDSPSPAGTSVPEAPRALKNPAPNPGDASETPHVL